MRLPQAVEALQRAVALDSTFALAWYRLGVATSWEARVELARDAIDRAMRHRSALPSHDRLLIEAYDAVVSREADRAERLYRAIVADYPSDVEAALGDATAQAKLIPELHATDDHSLILAVWRAGVFSDDLTAVPLRSTPHRSAALAGSASTRPRNACSSGTCAGAVDQGAGRACGACHIEPGVGGGVSGVILSDTDSAAVTTGARDDARSTATLQRSSNDPGDEPCRHLGQRTRQ